MRIHYRQLYHYAKTIDMMSAGAIICGITASNILYTTQDYDLASQKP